MAGRGRPGVEPQMEKREEFARFVRTGVSISEAARRVGVNRKTGMRWCHGRTITTPRGVVHHYPSVLAAASEPDVSARYLSEDERTRIADLTTRGAGVREIARDIGRSPSTVSRELRRNTDRSDGSYRPFAAQQRRASSGLAGTSGKWGALVRPSRPFTAPRRRVGPRRPCQLSAVSRGRRPFSASAPGHDAASATGTRQDRQRRGAPPLRVREAEEALEPRPDKPRASRGVRRRTRATPRGRDDLPGLLPTRARWPRP